MPKPRRTCDAEFLDLVSPSILSFSADLFFLENSGAACFGVAPEERGGRGVSAGFAKVAQRFGTCNRAQNHGIRPLKMDVYTESYTGVHGRNELSALSVAKSFQASRMFGRRGVGAFEFSKHRNTSMCQRSYSRAFHKATFLCRKSKRIADGKAPRSPTRRDLAMWTLSFDVEK